jgi:hypothetical protein
MKSALSNGYQIRGLQVLFAVEYIGIIGFI